MLNSYLPVAAATLVARAEAELAVAEEEVEVVVEER